jgi:hypothetical protein
MVPTTKPPSPPLGLSHKITHQNIGRRSFIKKNPKLLKNCRVMPQSGAIPKHGAYRQGGFRVVEFLGIFSPMDGPYPPGGKRERLS